MHLDCFEPQGAFYMFPSIKRFGMTSEEFATRLLQGKKRWQLYREPPSVTAERDSCAYPLPIP